MAMIHVIIPCYNVEEYLEQAAYSVLNQPSKEIDIILVDDGSPDDTPRICDEIARKEPRVHVIHQKNGGLCAARNAGIEYVLNNLITEGQREFIGFVDADDAWCPNVIDDKLLHHLCTDWNEDVIGFSGVYSNVQMDRYSHKMSDDDVTADRGETLMWIAQKAHLGSKLYSVEMFRKWNIRFQYKQLYTEDKIFILQFFFLAESARLVSKPLYIYRKNKHGIMSKLMKMNATNHYLPIIDGWRKCDHFLNELEDRTGRHCVSGYTLAAAYLVEMVAEHFKKWGSRKEIFEVLTSHPHYTYACHAKAADFTAKAYQENRLMFEHPALFEIKYRMIGIVELVAWKALSIPAVNRIREQKNYPYTTISID